MSRTEGNTAPHVAVLVVCTGNICRSPAAELLLRTGLDDRAAVKVASAGLEARAGEPVAAPMARLLRARGIEPDGFVARQFEPGMVTAADLVLTMTVGQRGAVVTRVPSAVRHTFTITEFADLSALSAEGLDEVHAGDRLRAAIREAPRARVRRVAGAGLDDIEDPFRRTNEVYARVFDRIEEAVHRLLGVLTSVEEAHHSTQSVERD